MHRYQRSDSAWANEHRAELHDFGRGFVPGRTELVGAFARYDCLQDIVLALSPPETSPGILPPEAFGDSWDEPLEREDLPVLDAYVRSFSRLERAFDFVAFEVAGEHHTITLGQRRRARSGRGLTFAAPRASLMAAVRQEVFDDLLIGNYVRTTVHGKARSDALYPDFTPYVCKFGDNGRARAPEELRAYFQAYRIRAPVDYFRHRLERAAADRVRGLVPKGSSAYRAGRFVFERLRAAPGRR
jgi:hypothetical protein